MFHNRSIQATRNVQVQTDYDHRHHHVYKDPLKQPHQVYPTMYHQQQLPSPTVSQQKNPQQTSQHFQAPYGIYSPSCYSSPNNHNIRPRSMQPHYTSTVHGQTVQYTAGTHGIPQYHHTVVMPAGQMVLSPKSLEQADLHAATEAARCTAVLAPTAPKPPHIDTVSVIRSPTGVVEHSSVNQRGIVYTPASRMTSSPAPCYSIIDVPGISSTGAGARQPPISTTKPYAVVNAIPMTQSLAFKRTTPPLYNPPASRNKNMFQSNKITSGTGTGSSYLSERELQRRDQSNAAAQKRIQDIAQIREEATSDLTQRLYSFSNKYKDFDTLTADDLMEIFHGALKKFQGNSRMYYSYAKKPANLRENVKTITTHQSETQVHDLEKTPIVVVSEPSLPKYIVCQRADQMDSMSKSNCSYQVQTSGVFIPPSEANSESSIYKLNNQQHYKTPQHSSSYAQKSAYGFSKDGVQSSPSLMTQTGSVVASVSVAQKTPLEKRRRKPDAPSNIHHIRTMFANNSKKNNRAFVDNKSDESSAEIKRTCSSCGKHATFLCSGCHKLWYCGRDCQVKTNIFNND